MGSEAIPTLEKREGKPMDERTTVSAGGTQGESGVAPVERLRAGMEREAELFARLGVQMDLLRDSFQAKSWPESLKIAQGFESSAREIERVDMERDEAFKILREGLGARPEESFSAVLMRVPEEQRANLDESWRKLRTSVFRLKTSTGRLRYASETLSEAFNSVVEGIFPHRRGKIYTRHGTASGATGSLIIDREL
jgi:hypothetical protein